jgi:hypothetical protein
MPKKQPRPRIFLQPGNELPEGYKLRDTFALSLGQWQKLIILNLIGAALFFLFGWFFLDTSIRQRPELANEIISFANQGVVILLIGNLLGAALFILIHELVHGLCFYYYTRTRPKFGLRLFYAYAAAPGWYLPKFNYCVVALAPFVLITSLGLLLIPIIPLVIAPAFIFGLTMNAAGSVGDFAVVIWLLRQPGKILIEDLGDSVNSYL